MAEDPVVQMAGWLRENQALQGSEEFSKVESAFRIAEGRRRTERLKGIAGEQPDDPTRAWTPFKSSGQAGSGDPATFGPAEIAAGHPLVRAAIGAARPVLAAGQALGLPVGGQRLQRELDRAGQLQEPGVNEVADVAGQFASPVNLGLAKAAGPVAGRAGMAVQGAVLGGMAGALTEVQDPEEKDFWSHKAWQGAGGATLGALVGPVMQMGGGAIAHAYKNWIEPVLANYSPRVRELVKQRLYAAAAGDPAKQQEVLAALQGSKEIVPGSSPTAGQAAVPAGSPTFSALTASAARAAPAEYAARADQQAGAALQTLGKVAVPEETLAGMEASRTRATNPLYEKARTDLSQPTWKPQTITMEGVDHPGKTSPLVDYLDATIARNPGNAALVREFKSIRSSLMDSKTGVVRTDPGELVSVLDGIKTAMKSEDNKFILKELELVKRRLSARLPRWREAEAAFSEESKPITQGKVGNKLVKAAQVPGGWRPGAGMPLQEGNFLKELDKGFGLASKDLTPEARQSIEQVAEEFRRNAAFMRQAELGSPAAPKLDKTGTSLPNLLMREAMIMNAILRRLEGKVSTKIAAEVATEVLNPQKVGDSLQKYMRRNQMNRARADMLEKMYRHGMPGAVQQVNQSADGQ